MSCLVRALALAVQVVLNSGDVTGDIRNIKEIANEPGDQVIEYLRETQASLPYSYKFYFLILFLARCFFATHSIVHCATGVIAEGGLGGHFVVFQVQKGRTGHNLKYEQVPRIIYPCTNSYPPPTSEIINRPDKCLSQSISQIHNNGELG